MGLRLLFAVCVALALPGPAAAYSKTDVRIAMDDGVELAATLYRPDAPASQALLLFHGLGGTRASTNILAEQAFADGYTVLTFDFRGHGDSGGLFSANGAREMADVARLYEWLAARPGIDRGRIGAWGISLGGGAVLRSIGEGVPFAAAEVVETWTDLYSALLPGGLAKSGAIYGFVSSVPSARTAPEVLAIREDALASRNLPALRTFAQARSTQALLGRGYPPTFVFQGRRDFAFGLEQGIAAFRGLSGPKRLYIGPFGHAPSTFPGPDGAEVFRQGRAWFDRFLKGVPNGIDTRPAVELAPDPYRAGASRSSSTPPATRLVRVRFAGGGRIAATASRTLGARLGGVETFGRPVVRLRASGSFPHLVARLDALAPDGRTITVAEGGAKLRLSSRPRLVSIPLASQATTIPRGSRLRLRLGPTSGDLLYIIGVPSQTSIRVDRVTLDLPVLRTPVSRP